jgi:hypothetical protein
VQETGVGVIVVSGATGTVSNRQPDDLANFAHNDPNDRHPAAGATIHVGGAHRSHLLVPTIPD